MASITQNSLAGRRVPGAMLCILVFALSASCASAAGLYRWVDENGDVHFGDQPPAGVQTRNVEGTVNGYTSDRALTSDEDDSSTDSSPAVTMYSAQWCGVCKTARRYMQQNNISFRELDIDESKNARRQWKRLGGKGVPLIVVGNQMMHGFSASGLASLRQR